MFVTLLGRASRKEGIAAMLIGDIDICRLMVYVHHVKKVNFGKQKGGISVNILGMHIIF